MMSEPFGLARGICKRRSSHSPGRKHRMAEEENKKKGRLAAAVLAGSALAFSSLAFGMPAALAQGEPEQEEQTQQASSGSPTESPAAEESSSASNERGADARNAEEPDDEASDEQSGAGQPSASASSQDTDTDDNNNADEATDRDITTQEQESDVSLDTNQVWPGGTVTVTGSGFTPNTELVVSLVENEIDVTEGPQLDTVTTDSDGAFSVTVTIPEETQPRDYNVEVYDEADNHNYGVPLDVLDDSDVEVDPSVYASPLSGPSGSTVAISGSGYTPYGEIDLSLMPKAGGEAITLDSVTASSNGMLETEYSLPDSIENGVYVLTAVDVRSGEETTNEFNVTDVTLKVDPETIPEEEFALEPSEGGGVTHIVEGLEPGTEVNFNVGNAYNPMEDLSGSATADDLGIAEYTVYDNDGSIYVGGYGTTVTLNDGTQVAQGNFEVTSEDPQVSLPSDPIAPGESTSLWGRNITPDADVTMNWELGETMTDQADSQGQFTHEIVVPDEAEAGTYEIEVIDEETGNSAIVELTVGTSDDDDDGETPISEPEITLDPAEVYQGEQVGLSGSGFTPDGEVEFVLDAEIFSRTADENGELAGAAIQVPRDLAAGTYDVLARDLETEGEATAELTVVEADEPVLRISPEEITLDEFIRDDEDDEGGVVHTVAGLEPGAEVDAVIDGP